MEDPIQHNTSAAPAARRQGRLAAIFLLLAGALIIAIAVAWSLRASRLPSDMPRVGRPLAEFALPDLEGRTVNLSDYAGRPVLINFWTTWCPPCRIEMPDLEALYYEQQENDLVILAINSGESHAAAAEFSDEFGLSFPVLLDESYALSNQWMIHNLPTTILVGRDGIVKVIHIGVFRSDQMEEKLLPHILR